MNTSGEKNPTWNYLIGETYQTYEKQLWTFTRMALVPAILAVGFKFLASGNILQQLREAYRHADLELLSAITDFAEGAVFFLMGALVFAQVASYIVSSNGDGHPPSSGFYAGARERVDSVFVTGLLPWIAFFLCHKIILLGAQRLMSRWMLSGMIGMLMIYLPLLLVAGALSRFGLVIPEVMHDRSLTLGQAIRNSVRKTEGWELFFMMFVAHLGAMAFIVNWVYGRSLWILWRIGISPQTSSAWLVPFLTTATAMVLGPILFVAFTIFWREITPEAEAVIKTLPLIPQSGTVRSTDQH